MPNADLREIGSLLTDPLRSFVIVTHRDPDFDAIGSCLAMYQQLKRLCRQVLIWVPDTLPLHAEFLPDSDEIVTALPSGYTYDTVISLDASNLDRIRQLDQVNPDAYWINIDHHQDNTYFGQANYVSGMSSVGELLSCIFKEFDWPITEDMANCLYTAILFDTGGFAHSNVSAQTFRSAARLVESGAKTAHIYHTMYEQLPLAAFEAIKVGLNSLIIDTELRYGYCLLPEVVAPFGYEVLDLVRRLAELDIVLIFREHSAGTIKINLRSKTDFNVADFAATFGGGGHRKAAGLALPGTLETVSGQVVNALRETLSRSV